MGSTEVSEPRNRFSRVRQQWGTNWFMWSHRNKRITLDDGDTIPGPKGFPSPWARTHLRSYFCTLTGGCSWGALHDDPLFSRSRKVKTCWKCRSTWINPEDFEEGER